MAESVDAPDLKSVGHYARGSSSLPTPISSRCNTHHDILTTSLTGGFFMVKIKLTYTT